MEQVQSGESPEDVIQVLGFSRSCIYSWLAKYRAGGWAALKAKAVPGRPVRISGSQMKWLYQTVTQNNPLQYRFEFLKRLIHRARRPVFLVLDGHSAHKAKLVSEYVNSL